MLKEEFDQQGVIYSKQHEGLFASWRGCWVVSAFSTGSGGGEQKELKDSCPQCKQIMALQLLLYTDRRSDLAILLETFHFLISISLVDRWISV